jgi:Metallopeptidase toxin 4
MAIPVTPCHSPVGYDQAANAESDAANAGGGPTLGAPVLSPTPSVFTNAASNIANYGGAGSTIAYVQYVNGGWAYFNADGELLGGAHYAKDGTLTYTAANETAPPGNTTDQGTPAQPPGPSGAAYAQNINGRWTYFAADGQLVGFAEAGLGGTVIYRDANGNVSSVMQPAAGGMQWFDSYGNLYDITSPGGWLHGPRSAPAPAPAYVEPEIVSPVPLIGPAAMFPGSWSVIRDPSTGELGMQWSFSWPTSPDLGTPADPHLANLANDTPATREDGAPIDLTAPPMPQSPASRSDAIPYLFTPQIPAPAGTPTERAADQAAAQASATSQADALASSGLQASIDAGASASLARIDATLESFARTYTLLESSPLLAPPPVAPASPVSDPAMENFLNQVYPPGVNGSPDVNQAFIKALGIGVALGMPPPPSRAAAPPPVPRPPPANALQKLPPWALFVQGLGDASKSLALGVLASEFPGVEKAASILSDPLDPWSWLQPPAGQVEQTLMKAVHRKLAPAAAEWGRTLDEHGLAVKSPLDGAGLVPEEFELGYMSAFNSRLAQTVEGTTPMLKTYDQYARGGGPAEGVAMAFNEAYNPLYRIPVGWMTAVDDWNKEDYRGSGRATGTAAFETGMLAVAVGGAVAGAAPAIRAGVGDFIEGELVSRGLSGGGATYEGSAEVQWGARLEEGRAFDGATALRESADLSFKRGALGGELYPPSELMNLKRDLASRGIELRLGPAHLQEGQAAGFDGPHRFMVFGDNPTQYDVAHEMAHLQQWEQLGPEAYDNLTRVQKEQFVFDALSNSPQWELFTDAERAHAVWYIEWVGGIR